MKRLLLQMMVVMPVAEKVGLGGVVLKFGLDKMFQYSEDYCSHNSRLVSQSLAKQQGSQQEQTSCSNVQRHGF